MSIPVGTKFHGVAPGVDTLNKGSVIANANRDAYTLEQIQGATSPGLARYQDTQYTGASDATKVILSDGVKVTLPNNAGTTTKSNASLSFYDNSTQKLNVENVNDVYIITVEFKASASNTQNTHLDLSVENGGVIENLEMVIPFYKGNNTTQQEHTMIQYYATSSFVSDGATLKIKSHGGAAKIWDIQYFIQRTQYGE